jgi:hypothetical protein
MEAMLQYRPADLRMLRGAVSILRKKRLRERYMGDLLWMIARAQYVTGFSMQPFSDYDDLLEGRRSRIEYENNAVRQKVTAMLDMFDRKGEDDAPV